VEDLAVQLEHFIQVVLEEEAVELLVQLQQQMLELFIIFLLEVLEEEHLAFQELLVLVVQMADLSAVVAVILVQETLAEQDQQQVKT
jgi:hypothetical protein